MQGAGVTLATTSWNALIGQYHLRPGEAQSVLGGRPVLEAGRLSQLLRGQQREQVTRTLTSVFPLCAHAHRHTAERALASAQSKSENQLFSAPNVTLYAETARDHLRSIALDWPQRQSSVITSSARPMDWLHDCPMSLATTRHNSDATATWALLAQLRKWLEQRCLHQPITDWLSRYRDPDTLAQWCHAQATVFTPARQLSDWHSLAHVLTPKTRCLDILNADNVLQTNDLQELAEALLTQPDFVQKPTWKGLCAESGPWTRLRHRPAPLLNRSSAWTRLSARWIELIELAAAVPPISSTQNQTPLLSSGALRLGCGQALAWCEMARGLLVHWVQLDSNDAVQDYRVLAPTEWNFHPHGALACALTQLAPEDTAAAQVLAAAFDPCVSCSIQTQAE